MRKYIIKRLLSTIPPIIAVVTLVFLIIQFVPGDPVTVMMGKEASEEVAAALRAKYGFDQPVHVQYLNWIKDLARGDLGESYSLKNPVVDLITKRLGHSGQICLLGITFSLVLAIPVGIICALKHNSIVDLGISAVTIILISVPSFWLAIMLSYVFGYKIPILPVFGHVPLSKDFWGSIKTTMLPAISVAAMMAATTARLLRTSLLEVMNEDYILLARTKGNSEGRIIFIHAMRNASIPVFTMITLQIAGLLGGVVIIERVYTFPGMGMLIVSAISNRDYPLIQGAILVFAMIIVVINLLTDILYAALDPRIRLTK
jgi:peptide/nickel transport system permease protein